MPPPLNALPPEVKGLISTFLTPREVANLQQVHRKLREATSDVQKKNALRVLQERLARIKELEKKLEKKAPKVYIPGLARDFANEKRKLLEQYDKELCAVFQLKQHLKKNWAIDGNKLEDAFKDLPEVLKLLRQLDDRFKQWY